jgi:hypothetical protein
VKNKRTTSATSDCGAENQGNFSANRGKTRMKGIANNPVRHTN